MIHFNLIVNQLQVPIFDFMRTYTFIFISEGRIHSRTAKGKSFEEAFKTATKDFVLPDLLSGMLVHEDN